MPTNLTIHPTRVFSASAQAAWKQRLAQVWTLAVVAGAVWSLIGIPWHLVMPRTVAAVDEVFETISVPAGHTFFSAVYLGVIATALRQGKHFAALWTFWVFGVLGIVAALGDIGLQVVFSGGRPHGITSPVWDTSDQVLNLVVLAISVGVAVLIWLIRNCYPARLAHGSRRLAVTVLVGGLLLSSAVALTLSELFPLTLQTQGEKVVWSVAAALGRSHSVSNTGHAGHTWVAYLAGFISAVAALLALAIFLRSVRKDHLLSEDDELQVRKLLLQSGDRDSLGYFATRRDKAAIFSPRRDAALAYRVVAGVSLASADPVGNPQSWPGAIRAWLDEARAYGWAPAVLSASEQGAQAYAAAGLRTLSMGDEAVIEVATFSLEGPTIAPVRQAVTRAERAGYSTRVVRHSELSPEETAEIVAKAQAWRGARTERGFSMALSRLGDPADGRCVMVLAYDASGVLSGLLSFVPWGLRGVSLDLMRRRPDSVNGLMEYMVASLIDACDGLGVDRVSMNFAMFREVFDRAERVGAGPVLKATNLALTLASRFWQLESLYQSNDKYLPRWAPRFICYGRNGSLTQALIASGIAEGFLPGPRPVWRSAKRSKVTDIAPQSATFADAVRQQERELLHPALGERRIGEQEQVRRHKLDLMRSVGMEPYPVSVPRTHTLRDVIELFPGLAPGEATATAVSVCGRVVSLRDHGRLCFATLADGRDRLQVMFTEGGCPALAHWRRFVDIGDHVSVTGNVVSTRTGELTVAAATWEMAAKCLHPLPDVRRDLAKPELRAGSRHLDLLTNPGSLRLLEKRTAAVRALREGFERRGFEEVETPMLQAVQGGANARPFVTHGTAVGAELYLRIAPELYLKRLCVAGMSKVFELNRSFRNEGADRSHNPEFTSLEAYEAYADYSRVRQLTREILVEVATAVHGKPVVLRPGDGEEHQELDISGDWPVQTVHEAVSAATGTAVTTDTAAAVLRDLARRHGVKTAPDLSAGQLVTRLYDELVEPATTLPTFYVDFPIETTPLARAHRTNPALAERWDLVAFGLEIGTGYSELVDPVEQRRRLTEQSLAAAAGDPEAMSLDEDFLSALEYAMPPTGGLGIGVDRVVMMLTGESIRRTLPFAYTGRG